MTGVGGYYDSYEVLEDPSATQRINAVRLLRALLDSAPADEREWGPLMREQVRALCSSVGSGLTEDPDSGILARP